MTSLILKFSLMRLGDGNLPVGPAECSSTSPSDDEKELGRGCSSVVGCWPRMHAALQFSPQHHSFSLTLARAPSNMISAPSVLS